MLEKQVTDFLTEIGELLSADGLASGEQDRVWGLAFEGEPGCFFRFGEAGDNILLTAPVGPVPEDGQLGLYALLLRANLDGAPTAGFRLCLEDMEEDGTMIVLAGNLPADGLEVSAAVEAVEAMRQVRSDWARVLARLAETTATTDEQTTENFGPNMRV